MSNKLYHEPMPEVVIEKIGLIEPLRTDMENHGGSCVPSKLVTPLFEPFHISDRLIIHNTYAILDASIVKNLPERLADTGLEHRCLYQGEALEEQGDIAPWIVRLDPAHAFTKQLFTYDPEDAAPWHHGTDRIGFFVRVDASIDAIWQHFRRFVRVKDENGQFAFLRFWDPHVLADGLVNGDTDFKMLLHDRHTGPIAIVVRGYDNTYVTALARAPLPNRAIVVNRAKLAVHFGYRRLHSFCQTNDIDYDPDAYRRYESVMHNADEIDYHILALHHGHFNRDETYNMRRAQTFGEQNRKTQLYNQLLFRKNQRLPHGV